jgi:hypothetical protein
MNAQQQEARIALERAEARRRRVWLSRRSPRLMQATIGTRRRTKVSVEWFRVEQGAMKQCCCCIGRRCADDGFALSIGFYRLWALSVEEEPRKFRAGLDQIGPEVHGYSIP